LQRPLAMSIPEVLHAGEQDLFADSDDSDGVVLFLYINFAVSDRNIRGYIAMLMDLPSVEALRVLITEFIQRVVGSEGAQSLQA
jgi:chemotaxis protein CheC